MLLRVPNFPSPIDFVLCCPSGNSCIKSALLQRNRLKMERALRTNKEFESLWEKLENLKRLDSDFAPAGNHNSAHNTDHLRTEITDRLGFFPSFFVPALDSPA